ncbi:MAG TPA: hypothetical protein VI072_27285 [Polyangiaceae bacterium]
MKHYVDFVEDIMDRPELLQSLRSCTPFDTVEELVFWFGCRGYRVEHAEAEALFSHQSELVSSSAQLNY